MTIVYFIVAYAVREINTVKVTKGYWEVRR